ncbi:hypothetical protein AQJ46_40870 [Streptomyces canus]|uniref:Lipoprotein n=1 Tax=Streptomyces canus TaxID=58343 RepID=A0A124HVQ2_9ACTN|nr:hypothetical protein AQJ46_40870 [Streptomyces canus]
MTRRIVVMGGALTVLAGCAGTTGPVAGPRGTGSTAPHMSPAYPADDGPAPTPMTVAPCADSGHVVVIDLRLGRGRCAQPVASTSASSCSRSGGPGRA